MINLDHISSNQIIMEAKEAMIAAIRDDYGNPSSQHSIGDQAAEILEKARVSVAALLNCTNPKEIVFTSGGTESNNHAIKGTAMANQKRGNNIIITNTEHNSVIRSLRRLKSSGFHITSLSVDAAGRVNPDEIAKAITDKTILISVMHSNNETGTIQPIAEIAEIAQKKKIIFHTDAVDSVGIMPIDVQSLGVDLLSFAANSFYGPAGVGGLFIKRGTRIWPFLDGGVQENNKRGGSENLIGIIGMMTAAQIAQKHLQTRQEHLEELKKTFLELLPKYIDEYIINTHPEHSLPHLVSLSIKHIEGESIMLMLDDDHIAISTRSACATGSLRASHVLLSLGLSHADAQGTILISFGVENTKDEIMQFLKSLQKAVTTLRNISPLYRS